MSKTDSDREGFNFLGGLFVVYTLFLQAAVWAMIFGWADRPGSSAYWYYFALMIICGMSGEIVRWSSAAPLSFDQEFFVTRLTLKGVFLLLWFVTMAVLYIRGIFKQEAQLVPGLRAICHATIVLYFIHFVSRTFHETHELKRRPINRPKTRPIKVTSVRLHGKNGFSNN